MAGHQDSSGESGETSKGLLLMPGFWGDGKRKSTDPCYSHCRRYISILQYIVDVYCMFAEGILKLLLV